MPLINFSNVLLINFSKMPLINFSNVLLINFNNMALINFSNILLINFNKVPLISFNGRHMISLKNTPLINQQYNPDQLQQCIMDQPINQSMFYVCSQQGGIRHTNFFLSILLIHLNTPLITSTKHHRSTSEDHHWSTSTAQRRSN